MRDKFNEQLEQLHIELIQMGALCEEAISAAAEALLKQDAALAEKAVAAERETTRRSMQKPITSAASDHIMPFLLRPAS